MFGLASHLWFKGKQHHNSLLFFHLEPRFDKKLRKCLITQQRSLENQIKTFAQVLSENGKNQTQLSQQSKLFIQNQTKLLAVQLALNTAEQRAIAGKEVESILQPMVTRLIEEKPNFPVKVQWLKEQICNIRDLRSSCKYC